MSARSELEFKIISLKEIVFHDYVDSVTLPTKAGQITVLPNHGSLISHLSKGIISAKISGERKSFEVNGGFVEVTPDSRLTVLL